MPFVPFVHLTEKNTGLKTMRVKNSHFRNFINRFWFKLADSWLVFPPIPKDNRILFFKRDRMDYFFLSNFFPCPLEIDGKKWPHTEAYYQARKSKNPLYHERILQKDKAWWAKYVGDSRIGDPKIAKKSWFKKYPDDLRDDWDDIKAGAMEKALYAKFTQHDYLKQALLKTAPAKIIEDSPNDFYWGMGHDGSGRNRLGNMLMQLREDLYHQ